MNLQCGSWTGAATHLIRLKHGVPLKKSNSLFFTQYQIMIFGKEPRGKPLPVSGVVSTSHLYLGAHMGVANKILPGIWFSSVFSYRFTTPQGQATFLHGFPQQQELWGTRWSWKLLWLVVSCLWSSYSSPERGSRENRRENQADGRWKTCFPYENSQVNRVIIVCWHDCCFHR